MNGLYGYPTPSSLALGAESSQSDIRLATDTAVKIVNGETLRDINQAKREFTADSKRVGKMRNDVMTIADQGKRQQAMDLWTEAASSMNTRKTDLNNLVDSYNEAVAGVRKVSLGMMNPGSATTLGAVPVAAVAGLVIAGGIVLIGILLAVAHAWATFFGSASTSKGYIEQTADLIKQFGKSSEVVLNRTVVIAGIVVGGYVLYQILSRGAIRRMGSEIRSAGSEVKQLKSEMALKTVPGKVL